MSDSSLTLSCSVNGTTYTTNINSALAAINSMRSGTSAPTNNIVDGTLWLDNSSSDNKIKIRIGSTWHTLSDFDGSNFYFEYAKKATQLETARTIGGVSFNGTENINLPGVNATGNQNTSGSAAKLATARTVTLTGDVSGSTTFDGESDVSITATVADDSHNHVVGNLDNFTEEVQDIIGGMVTGNTESNITVTYEDGDGTLDFTVPTPDITGTSLGGVLGGTVGSASINADVVGESNFKVGGTLSDGSVLTADSTATGGMKWAASGGGAILATASSGQSGEFTAPASGVIRVTGCGGGGGGTTRTQLVDVGGSGGGGAGGKVWMQTVTVNSTGNVAYSVGNGGARAPDGDSTTQGGGAGNPTTVGNLTLGGGGGGRRLGNGAAGGGNGGVVSGSGISNTTGDFFIQASGTAGGGGAENSNLASAGGGGGLEYAGTSQGAGGAGRRRGTGSAGRGGFLIVYSE